jgi:hypothetical protein
MPIHPADLAEQRRIIRKVHVGHRPAPGGPEPEPLAEPTGDVDHSAGIAEARHALVEPPKPRAEHPTGCQCSTWCRDDWTYAAHGAPALGPCSVCGELCRSIDPEGRMRHPMCAVAS